MRIDTKAEALDTNLETETIAYSIKQSAHAFMVLSKNMYSAPIRAVIREILCNATDSHLSAGKSVKDIEVTLPTRDNMSFSVKDFGTGLAFKDVEKLYSTYFESTKGLDDDATGGFGIGAKSPYSYADRFTVDARWNGKQRIYTCYVSDGSDGAEVGAPSMRQIGEEFDTTEPNGLTVTLSVKAQDVYTFQKEYKNVAVWFADKPTCNIFREAGELALPEDTISKEFYSIMPRFGGFSGSAYVLQGNVLYPINLGDFQNTENFSASLTRSNHMAVFKVPVGSVSPAPSREQLTYDAKTVANINSLIKRMLTDVTKDYQEEINTAKSEWEAYKIFNSLSTKPYFTTKSYFYDGIELVGSKVSTFSIKEKDLKGKLSNKEVFSMSLYDIPNYISDAVCSKRSREVWVKGDDTYTFPFYYTHNIVVIPHSRFRHVQKIKKLTQQETLTNNSWIVIIADSADIPVIKAAFRGANIRTTLPELDKAPPRPKGIVKPYVVTTARCSTISKSELEKVDVDFDKGGKYTKTDLFRLVSHDLILGGLKTELIKKEDFYVVPKSMWKKFDESPKWSLIDNDIKKSLSKTKYEALLQKRNKHIVWNKLGQNYIHSYSSDARIQAGLYFIAQSLPELKLSSLVKNKIEEENLNTTSNYYLNMCKEVFGKVNNEEPDPTHYFKAELDVFKKHEKEYNALIKISRIRENSTDCAVYAILKDYVENQKKEGIYL